MMSALHIHRPVRPPRHVSVCDLVLEGFLEEDDVDEHGSVSETRRRDAEVAYAVAHSAPRPRTAPVARPSRPARTVAPPLLPRHALTTAHVHRVSRLRRHAAPQAARPDERPRVHDPDERPRVHDPVDVDEDHACCICKGRPRTFAFAPCFHMCVCGACAVKVVQCPLCRHPIHARHRIWT